MNKVILIGRLVRDPELRYTQSQRAVCTFTLAVDKRLSRERKNELEAQNRPTADFLRITVWGVQGENASKYLRKGSQCAVYTTDVVADNVEFIGSRSDNQSSTYNNNSYDNQDTYRNDYSQTNNYQQNRGNNNNNQAFDGGDDFFDDDFTEIEDDGRIPF